MLNTYLFKILTQSKLLLSFQTCMYCRLQTENIKHPFAERSRNVFAFINNFNLLYRFQRISMFCASWGPETSTWTRPESSCASRSPGGSSIRWTSCWTHGSARSCSRTITPEAGTTTTEVQAATCLFYLNFISFSLHLTAYCCRAVVCPQLKWTLIIGLKDKEAGWFKSSVFIKSSWVEMTC